MFVCVREREMKCTGECLVGFFLSVPEVVYSDVHVYSRSQSARAYLGWKVCVQVCWGAVCVLC